MKKIINFLKNLVSTIMQSWIFYSTMSIILIALICFNAISGYFYIQGLRELNNKYENYYVIPKKYQLAGYLIGTDPNNSEHSIMLYFNSKELKYDIFGDPDCIKCKEEDYNGKQNPFEQDTYFTKSGTHDIKVYKNCNISAPEGIFNAWHDSTSCSYCLYRNKGIFHSAYTYPITYMVKKEGN